MKRYREASEPFEENHSDLGWCIIPPHIMMRDDLTHAQKLLYGRINGLTGKRGYCYAGNAWLGNQLKLDLGTVSNMVTDMRSKGLFHVDVIRDGGKRVIERRIYVLPCINPTMTTSQSYSHEGLNPTVTTSQSYNLVEETTIQENKEVRKKEITNCPPHEIDQAPSTEDEQKKVLQFSSPSPYYEVARRLSGIVGQKKRIRNSPDRLRQWAIPIRQLVEKDAINIERLNKTLNWYSRHCYEEFVPVIESGSSLREKFLKLEAAIERDEKKRNGSGSFDKKTHPKNVILASEEEAKQYAFNDMVMHDDGSLDIYDRETGEIVETIT